MERTWGSRRILKAVSRYATSLCVDWLPRPLRPYRRSVSKALGQWLLSLYPQGW